MKSREAALKILYKVEIDEGYVNLLISDTLKSVQSGAERNFASNIVYGVLKNKLALDYCIGQFSKIKVDKLSTWVINILRCGVLQMMYMDKVPHSAACNESVKLARKYANSGAVGFVNGVLRNVARNIEKIKFPDKDKDVILYLSVKYSHPQWIVKRFLKQYGELRCEEILKGNNEVPKVFLRTNMLKITPNELIEILQKEGIECKVDDELMYCMCAESGAGLTYLKAYVDGLFSIQDKSSMTAVQVMLPKAGDIVLDMCAAPGGKAAHIAEMMNDTGEVIACDIHEHKIKLIEDVKNRLGLTIIKPRLQDSAEFCAEFEDRFDKVLLDAPCSGLGVIHKKPDIRWSRCEEDIEKLVEVQGVMLQNAARYVKSGGTLLYSTCTVLEEENSLQIERFLSQHKEFKKAESHEILTCDTGASGFYICKLVKE